MRAVCLFVVALTAHAADADVYGSVSGGDATFYRISTVDASLELVSHAPGYESIFEIALGPDGYHYGIGNIAIGFNLVQPSTGWSHYLECLCAQQWATGGVTVTPQGMAYIGMSGFVSPIIGWNVHTGSFQGGFGLGGETISFFALQWRDDGWLIGADYDGVVYEIDTVADVAHEVGLLSPEISRIYSFARESTSDRTYMLAEIAGAYRLYEIDPYSFELTTIGDIPAQIGITGIAGIEICAADFNADGVLNILDVVDMSVAFKAGDLAADFNGDLILNVLDFVAYHELYGQGCP